MLERGARGKIGAGRIFVRLVANHDDFAHPFGMHLLRDQHRVQLAVDGLAAGHGHGVVEQNLIGNVDLGRDAGAYRHQA